MAWLAYQNLFERRNLMGFIDVENVRYQFSLQLDGILLRLIKLCVNWFQSRKYHDMLWYAINRNDDSRIKKWVHKKKTPKKFIEIDTTRWLRFQNANSNQSKNFVVVIPRDKYWINFSQTSDIMSSADGINSDARINFHTIRLANNIQLLN